MNLPVPLTHAPRRGEPETVGNIHVGDISCSGTGGGEQSRKFRVGVATQLYGCDRLLSEICGDSRREVDVVLVDAVIAKLFRDK